MLGGLPGVAADPAEVLDGVAGDPIAEDLASVLIPGEERGADREADIRSLSCHVCPALAGLVLTVAVATDSVSAALW